jgi:hypothetical protein
VCVIVTGSAAALVRRDLQDDAARYPTSSVSGPLIRLAEEQGLKHGYAGYWDASPITWQAKGAIQVYPVKTCPAGRARICPYHLHQISSWYRPRPRTRTFLVSDPTQPGSRIEAPRGLGAPALVRFIGPVTVYVYGYDIASRFGP